MISNVKEAYEWLWREFGEATHKDEGFAYFQINWFLERFGLSWDEFSRMIDDKDVLEIGTGSGAFLKWLHPAKSRTGLDISETGTSIARQVYEGLDDVKIITEDFMKWTPSHKYDVVIADQVLHHINYTIGALRKAAILVKVEGYLFFYLYKKKAPMREFIDSTLRVLIAYSPDPICLAFSKLMCWLGRNLSHIDLGLQRWVYWNIIKCFWNDSFTYENNLRVNYDWYKPKIARRFTLEEVMKMIPELGINYIIENINVSKSGVSVLLHVLN